MNYTGRVLPGTDQSPGDVSHTQFSLASRRVIADDTILGAGILLADTPTVHKHTHTHTALNPYIWIEGRSPSHGFETKAS